jgi:hypothetical protein
MMNKSSGATAPVVELALGTIVYDVEGEKVGKVTFSTLHTGYFVVQQGWLLTRDIYLPPDAIQLREEDWIKLRLSKEELKLERWKNPPHEHLQGASPAAMARESEAMPAGEPLQHLPEEELPPLANR